MSNSQKEKTMESKEDPNQVSSDNITSDWYYRKKLNISNPVTDYQMNLNVSYDGGGDVSCEGHCNSNFSDLRFTAADETSLRSYWIEEKVNNNYAEVWVNTSGDSEMYMYYGNDEALSKSNGTATFPFFEDFEGQSDGTNPDGWVEINNAGEWNIDTGYSYHGGASLKCAGKNYESTPAAGYYPINKKFSALHWHTALSYESQNNKEGHLLALRNNTGSVLTGTNFYTEDGDNDLDPKHINGSQHKDVLSTRQWVEAEITDIDFSNYTSDSNLNTPGYNSTSWEDTPFKTNDSVAQIYTQSDGDGACPIFYDLIFAVKYSQKDPSWSGFGKEEHVAVDVPSTEPQDGGEKIPVDKKVKIIFSNSMNTSVTPTINQTNGTDPGGWNFEGWSSVNVENDMGTWTHNDWSYNDHITLNVSGYEDIYNNTGEPYEWSFTTKYAHDINVTGINCSSYVKVGEKTFVNGTLYNEGSNNETNVDVQVIVDSDVKNTTTISELNISESENVSISWTPTNHGERVVELNATPVFDENDTADNEKNTTIYTDGMPPDINDLTDVNSAVTTEETVDIYSNVTDDHSLGNATLYYRNETSSWGSITMNTVSSNSTSATYKATIPRQPNETNVYYYVNATDSLGNYNVSWTNNYSVDKVPEIRNISYDPAHPNGSSEVNITADLIDNDGIDSAYLFYSYDAGATWDNKTMNWSTGDEYYGSIPPIESNITVRYYIEATSNINLTNTSSIHTYTVDDEVPEIGTPIINPQYPNATCSVDVKAPVSDSGKVQNGTLYYSFDNKNTWNSTDLDVNPIYFTDFEGAEIWTHSGSEDEWERGNGDPDGDDAADNDGQGPTSAHSDSNAWATDLDGLYNNDNDWGTDLIAELRSPTIQLSNALDPKLTFWDWLDVEGSIVDHCKVRIYTQTDSTYYNLANDYDNDHTWQQQNFDIPSGCIGDKIEIVFQLYADSSIRDYGWVIDDVRIGPKGLEGTIPSAGQNASKVYYYFNATDSAGNTNSSQIYNYTIDSISPEIVNVSSVPSPKDAYVNTTIYTNLSDDYSGIDEVNLQYSYDGTNWSSTNMTLISGNEMNASYKGVLPATDNETIVSYYVEAFDRARNRNTSAQYSFQTTYPPEIEDISYSPAYPNGSSLVNVTANISDSDGIYNATLYYSTDGGSTWSDVSMSFASGDEYYGMIPSQGANLTVYYYIEAQDNFFIKNTSATYSFYVDNEPPDYGTLVLSPSNPDAEDSVSVSIPLLDINNITHAELYYSFDDMTSWNKTKLDHISGDDWRGTIPSAGQDVPSVYYYVKCSDAAGNENTSSTFHYHIDINPPVADAGDDRTIFEGANITFDGTNSTDNSYIHTYKWSFFYDGSVELYGATPNFLFENVGEYVVTLNVTDYAGNWDTDTVLIEVKEDIDPPTADAGIDRTVSQFTTITLDATNSTDNAGIENYTWTFDDEGKVKLYGLNPDYTFDNIGNIPVVLTVKDSNGHSDNDTIWINVTDNKCPNADAGADKEISLFTTVNLDASDSRDNGEIIDYRWKIISDNNIILSGKETEYTFNEIGDYRVELKVIDTQLNWDKDILWVNVTDTVCPNAKIGADRTVLVSSNVTFNGSRSTDNVGIVNYTWTMLDEENRIFFGPHVSYAFPEKGVYNVSLNVTDAEGNYDSQTITIEVTDVPFDTIHPNAVAGTDITTEVGKEITLNGSKSTDNMGIISYTWIIEGEERTRCSINHSFDQKGDYMIILLVVDAAGNEDSDLLHVTVQADDQGGGDQPEDESESASSLTGTLLSIWGLALLILPLVAVSIYIFFRREKRSSSENNNQKNGENKDKEAG